MAQPSTNDVLTWDGTKGVYAPPTGTPSLALANSYIFVGNEIGVAVGVPLTLGSEAGPFSLANTGVLTMPDASASGRGLLNATGWGTAGFLHNDGTGSLEFQAISFSQDLATTLTVGNSTGGTAIISEDAGTELRVFDSNKGYFINSVGVAGISNEAFVNPNKLQLAAAGVYVGHDTLVSLNYAGGAATGTYTMNASYSLSTHTVLIYDSSPAITQQTPTVSGRYGVNTFTNTTARHGIVQTSLIGGGFNSYVNHSVTEMLLKQSAKISFDAPAYAITNITTDSYLYVDSSGNIIAGTTPLVTVPGLSTVLGVSGVTGDQAIKSANNKSQLLVYNAGSSLSYADGAETTSHVVNSGNVSMTYDNSSTFEAGHMSLTIAGAEITHNVSVLAGYDDGTNLSYSAYTVGQARLLFNNGSAGGAVNVTSSFNYIDHTAQVTLDAPVLQFTTSAFQISYLTNDRVVCMGAGGQLESSVVTITELSYVSGATSPLQAQIDAIVSGLSWKQAVRVRTTANITLSGAQTIDGVSVIAGDRVLVMNQTLPTENGIYICAAGAWSRSTDADTGAELLQATVATQEGTLYADQQYVCTTNAPIVIGVSNIVFILVGGTTYVGTSNRITVTGNVIDIAATYLGQTSITTLGTVTTGTWNATAINFAYIAAMSSANLAGIITDETGFSSGALLVFSKSPAIEAPTVSGIAVFSGVINESQGANIASAGTTDIGAATGNYVNVTGTTTITALGTIQAGTRRIVNFTGALTLTYNATSLILPGAANITTVAGDVAEFVSLGSGNWICTSYQGSVGLIISQSYTFDGQGSVIAVGSQGTIEWVQSGTIIGWTLLEVSNTPVSSSIVVDAWKAAYASYPPVVGNTIFGTKPALSSATKNTASGLSIAVAAGDIMKANVDSVTSALKVKLIFHLLVRA